LAFSLTIPADKLQSFIADIISRLFQNPSKRDSAPDMGLLLFIQHREIMFSSLREKWSHF
jgi:hypothetical protein